MLTVTFLTEIIYFTIGLALVPMAKMVYRFVKSQWTIWQLKRQIRELERQIQAQA